MTRLRLFGVFLMAVPVTSLLVTMACGPSADNAQTLQPEAGLDARPSGRQSRPRRGSGDKQTSGSNGSGLGSSCASDSDCPSTMFCISTGRCLCKPGLDSSPEGCYDPTSDPNHCGGWTNACAVGESCQAGLCTQPGAGARIRPFTTIGTAIELDGRNPSTHCTEASEGYPTLSQNDEATLFIAYQNAGSSPFSYNFGDAGPSDWGTRPSGGVTFASGVSGIADNWSATSSYSGLEYVSRIANTAVGGSNYDCVGVAATSVGDLTSGTWDYPVNCATAPYTMTNGVADGPAIHYDTSGTDFYVVENDVPCDTCEDTGSLRLSIYKNCGAGQPGQADGGCPTTTSQKCVRGASQSEYGINGHGTVTVNPCTHHAIVAYIWGGSVVLSFFDDTGTRITDYTVSESDGFHNQVTACGACSNDGVVPRCGNYCTEQGSSKECGEEIAGQAADGGTSNVGCARLAGKVQVANAVADSGATCYSYVAWDSNCITHDDAGDSFFPAMRANMAIVDVTNETNLSDGSVYPKLVTSYKSTACSTDTTTQEFGSIVTASKYTHGNVGWFYYNQPSSGDACQSSYIGWTDTSYGTTTMTKLTSPVSGSSTFPTMRFVTAHGMGDYWGIPKGGLPGGDLFPTWTQPVQTTATCVKCQGVENSLGIFGTRVTP